MEQNMGQAVSTALEKACHTHFKPDFIDSIRRDSEYLIELIKALELVSDDPQLRAVIHNIVASSVLVWQSASQEALNLMQFQISDKIAEISSEKDFDEGEKALYLLRLLHDLCVVHALRDPHAGGQAIAYYAQEAWKLCRHLTCGPWPATADLWQWIMNNTEQYLFVVHVVFTQLRSIRIEYRS